MFTDTQLVGSFISIETWLLKRLKWGGWLLWWTQESMPHLGRHPLLMEEWYSSVADLCGFFLVAVKKSGFLYEVLAMN